MINYYIAPDYQKIVSDIIFYMYLISVHFETCALAGPNAELFMGGISITCSLSNWGLGLCIEEAIRAFSIGLRRCPRFHRWEGVRVTQSHRSGRPCSTALKLGQYIRKSYQHLCQHCFKRNMSFFFSPTAYVLLFNTFAWARWQVYVSLVSRILFLISFCFICLI